MELGQVSSEPGLCAADLSISNFVLSLPLRVGVLWGGAHTERKSPGCAIWRVQSGRSLGSLWFPPVYN